MLNVFGLDYLKSGTGVMDVAGGKGEVSFELLNLNGIQSTVNDPRPLDLYRYKRKLEFGFYHRNEMFECYNPSPKPLSSSSLPSSSEEQNNLNTISVCQSDDKSTISASSSSLKICQLPQHIRAYFEMYDSYKSASLLNQLRSTHQSQKNYLPLSLQSPEEFLMQLERSQQTKWTKKGLQHENDEGYDEENNNDENDNNDEDDDENENNQDEQSEQLDDHDEGLNY